jgi:formylglycine-generating enzyme required for sulfatase activity
MPPFARPAAAALLFACLSASLSAQPLTYELVDVGSPGNAPDVTTFGAVAYPYRIGKVEVTVADYAAFLNAVARTDTYGLWNNGMQAAPSGAGITRSGAAGSYVYAPMTATSGSAPYTAGGTPPFRTVNGVDSSRFPITYVSWLSAARFANWMANGQPVGAQDASTTEDGAYRLAGAIRGGAPALNATNPNTGQAPRFRIPTENEWYKAAYYDPQLNGGRGGYHRYATRSDTPPGNVVPGSGTSPTQPPSNQANYIFGANYLYSVTQAAAIVTTQHYLTPVGTFAATTSPWGALDMNGSVWELNTLTGAGTLNIGIRGGAWTSLASYLASTYFLGSVTYSTASNVGFRLAAPAQ